VTTLAHLRRTALSLPGAVESDRGSFTVASAPFAVFRDGDVELPLTPADEFLAAFPAARRVPGGARIGLADINGQQLNHWVRQAWLAQAPAELTARAETAAVAVPGAVGDLPRSIGRPATQALAGAGLTTLARAAALSDAELLALHGSARRLCGCYARPPKTPDHPATSAHSHSRATRRRAAPPAVQEA
jgi:hypothetical protein